MEQPKSQITVDVEVRVHAGSPMLAVAESIARELCGSDLAKLEIVVLAVEDKKLRAALREALRQSTPGDVVDVHAEDCPMGDRCDCEAVRLTIGARA